MADRDNSPLPLHPCAGFMQAATRPYPRKLSLFGQAPFLGSLVLALAAVSLGESRAQSAQEPAASLPPPEEMSGADLINSMRSEVRIIARENHEIEEYRAGNNVYMIKVKPRNAPPYYLIDQDGSGNLQWSRGSDLERVAVPHWAIVRW